MEGQNDKQTVKVNIDIKEIDLKDTVMWKIFDFLKELKEDRKIDFEMKQEKKERLLTGINAQQKENIKNKRKKC